MNVMRLVAGLIVGTLCSCSAMKARPVALSPFLPHAALLKPAREQSPFLLAWRNSAATAERARVERPKIYVAPATLAYLRPASRSMSERVCDDAQRKVEVATFARLLTSGVSDALLRTPKARYQLVAGPARTALTLELAITEWNPTSATGGLLRTALNAAAAPGVDSLLAKRLKGNIAIEGRLRDGATGESLYEFADNEENKSPLLFSVNDFKLSGQAQQAINEWSAQIARVVNARDGERVKDSAPFVILPWQ